MSTAFKKLKNCNKCTVSALLFLAASTSFNVYALGFGKPAVESALGEPLRIVLPLTALDPNEINDLVARLAGPTWFQLSGLDYGEINDQLIVSVDSSLSALVISTQQPVSQVVVPLVIELEGPRKVMRKQFTVLINPATYEQAVASSAAPVSLSSGFSLAEGVTGNSDVTVGAATSVAQSANQSDLLAATTTPATASPLTASIAPSQSPLPVRADRVVVARGDSLSTIVDRFLPDGANRYQGRMAFYNVNASAFSQGNIHTLTQGAELVVPPEQDILALSSAQARLDYQTLAQLPTPGEFTSTLASGDESSNTNTAAGASVVGSASGQKEGHNQDAAQDQSEGDFRLSLLDVEDEETTTEKTDDSNNADESNENAVTDESLVLNSSAAGESFEMQGFTMKLSVMNAYIVELQEENDELKSRVATLEKKVQALIARDAGNEGALASVTSSIAATATQTEEEATDVPDNAQETTEGLLAAEEQDLASVLETSPELLVTKESIGESVSEVNELVDQSADAGAIAITDEALVTAQTNDASTGGTAVEAESGEISDTNVDSTVEQMLAELDAELNRAESDGVQGESELPEVAETEATVEEEVVRSSISSVAGDVEQPKATFRQDLMDKAKSLLGDLNGPILQLLVAVILLAGLLFAWMMRRGKKKNAVQETQSDTAKYGQQANDTVGVTYSPDNQLSLLEEDDEDDQWVVQQDVNLENIDSLDGSDVDLITQSEVYLTYNRPMQAVQALMEEYAKQDTDKFVVGSRLIKVFEKIGGSDERNTAMRNFIVTLNNDIEEFTNSEWDALRFDLDALRRQEQSSALDKEEEPSIEMNSFNPSLEEDSGIAGLSLDESSIDLDFHNTDKSADKPG